MIACLRRGWPGGRSDAAPARPPWDALLKRAPGSWPPTSTTRPTANSREAARNREIPALRCNPGARHRRRNAGRRGPLGNPRHRIQQCRSRWFAGHSGAGRAHWASICRQQPSHAAVQLTPPTCAYSSRNASAGLTRNARLAGAINAATDVAMTTATIASRVTGSSGFTP